MSDQNNNGTGSQQNNPGSYSADYVKELRDEAASWRTKFRDAEQSLSSMNDKLASMEKTFTLKSELDKRGVAVDPSWVKVEEGMSPSQAVDKFVEQYPQFQTENNQNNSQPQPSPTPRPMKPEKQNSNAPKFKDSDYKSIKNDPVARSKLRDMYRSMLGDGNNGPKI